MRILISVLLLPLTSCSQQKLPLQEMAAQMIMIGLPDNVIDINSIFYKDVKAGKMGGFTMYERHLTPTNTAENLKNIIATYQQISPLPLFVAITQEGGLVNRLKPKYGFPPMPSAEYLGKVNNLDSTKYYSDNIARTLSVLGINVNFAPVVDIYRADNPVLGSRERTFSLRTD
jgi:beta-N-acetylhexosaminidase